MGYLILVRNGESRWNIANKFTGWVDVPLSEKGVEQTIKTANKLEKYDIDVAFTSKLVRAQETLLLILSQQKKTGIFLHKNDWKSKWFLRYDNKEFEKDEIPIHTSEKLNERYYGKIQGMNKDDVRNKWGEEKVFEWRRSFNVKPPSGESLKRVYKRTISYFKSKIMKHIKSNQNVIVSAHGNNLRSIIKYVLNIGDNDIASLNLDFDKPIVFDYNQGELKLISNKLSFDRPIEWEAKKSKSKNTKKILVKKNTTKKKTTSKKRTPAKKSIAKNKTTKKKITRKKISKKITSNNKKSTKKKSSSKKSIKKRVSKKKPIKRKSSKKTTSKKKPAKKKKSRK